MTLYYCVVALQLLDIATTWYLLGRKGYAEGNSLMRWVFGKVGVVAGLLVTKGVFIAALYFYQPHVYGMYALIALYAAVIGNNCYHVYRSKQ